MGCVIFHPPPECDFASAGFALYTTLTFQNPFFAIFTFCILLAYCEILLLLCLHYMQVLPWGILLKLPLYSIWLTTCKFLLATVFTLIVAQTGGNPGFFSTLIFHMVSTLHLSFAVLTFHFDYIFQNPDFAIFAFYMLLTPCEILILLFLHWVWLIACEILWNSFEMYSSHRVCNLH